MYEDNESDDRGICPTLLDHIPVVDWASEKSIDDIMLRTFRATRMYRVDLFAKPVQDPSGGVHRRRYVTPYDEYDNDIRSATVHMLTDVTSVNQIKSTFIAYENKASLSLVYMRICLIVDVGPAGTRLLTPLLRGRRPI